MTGGFFTTSTIWEALTRSLGRWNLSFCDVNGHADFWRDSGLAWRPHLNKLTVWLPIGCPIIVYATDKGKHVPSSTVNLNPNLRCVKKQQSVHFRLRKTQYSISLKLVEATHSGKSSWLPKTEWDAPWMLSQQAVLSLVLLRSSS